MITSSSVSTGAEYRGVVQYYLLAGDVARLTRLHWVMVTSLLKTLAGKYDSSVTKMARKYQTTIVTPSGPRKCMQVSVERGEGRKPLVARFGGIPLRRQKNAVPVDHEPGRPTAGTKELIVRFRARRCEMCERAATVQVHQVRKLADLLDPGQPKTPRWMALMARRRRTTLVVCQPCHNAIHHRQPNPSFTQ
jgi:hypothetical protein